MTDSGRATQRESWRWNPPIGDPGDPNQTLCNNDCGCAGARSARTCVFWPNCSRCRGAGEHYEDTDYTSFEGSELIDLPTNTHSHHLSFLED